MFICDISIFNRYGKQSLDTLLKPLGLDWQGLVAILVIDQVQGITQQRLIPFLQTDKANVSKMIATLEDSDLVYREKKFNDLRNKACYLTEKGNSLVSQLQKTLVDWEASLYQNINAEDLEVFKRVSEQITKNLIPRWDLVE